MTWSQEISQLVTSVDQLTSAVNVKKSTLDATTASIETAKNLTANSAVAAANSAASSLTSSQTAETHKNTALAIYSTSAAQQTAIASTQASSFAASGFAADASAALQQNLSGINIAALHRSPNAITSMFVYDTSKDSDGGAWTEKCQHTSWWNEPLMGKWLGQYPNETLARFGNATLGDELITNGDFSNGSTGWTLNGFTVTNGVAVSTASSIVLAQNVATTAGKLYRVEYDVSLSASVVTSIIRLNSAGNLASTIIGAGGFGRIIEYVIAGSGTTGLRIITTAGANIFSLDNISVREVVTVNTTSGDYYQSTGDGKFNRLWNNLIKYSEDFSQWTMLGSAVRTLGQVGPIGLSNAAKIVYSAANINSRINSQLTNNRIGPHTTSIWMKGEVGGEAITISDGWGGNGTFTLTTSWVRYSYTFNAMNNTGVYIFATSGTPTIYIADAQIEPGSVATAYETKTTLASTSEVFRGNKRDFPKLAAIVNEVNGIIIYDLVEPGRPMWKIFRTYDFSLASSYEHMLHISRGTLASTSAINGIICAGSTTLGGGNPVNGGGLHIFDFAQDRIYTRIGFYGGDTGRMITMNQYSNVNSSTIAFRHNLPAIVSIAINGVAMAVLPDAPIDPATGLRIPTIAVQTASGVSVINNDGTVAALTKGFNETSNFGSIWITPRAVYATTVGGSGGQCVVGWTNFKTSNANFHYVTGFSSAQMPFGNINNPTITGQKPFAKNTFGLLTQQVGTTGRTLSLITENRSGGYLRAVGAVISDTYATGMMMADTRRCYLSDTEVGATGSGEELVTDPSFDNPASWSATNATVTGGEVVFSANTGYVTQLISGLVPGRTYKVTVTHAGIAPNNGGGYVTFVSASNGTPVGSTNRIVGSGATSFNIIATVGNNYLSVGNAAFTNGGFGSLQSVSVREVVLDRSYRAASSNIEGSVARAQLALGTSLVGYSGWSNTNYLREPYSADLDFGTGEFSASAWMNTSGYAPHNELSFPEDFTASPWINTSFVNQTVNVTVVPAAGTSPFGDNTATKLVLNSSQSGDPNTSKLFRGIAGLATNGPWSFSIYAKAAGIDVIRIYHGNAQGNPEPGIATGLQYTFSTDTLVSYAGNTGSNRIATRELLSDGWVRLNIHRPTGDGSAGTGGLWVTFNNTVTGDGTSGVLIFGAAVNRGPTPSLYLKGLTSTWSRVAPIAARAHSSGPAITLGLDKEGKLTASAFDGATTRTTTTAATYNNGNWLNAGVNYTTDGSLAIQVNGREVAVTRGTPLLPLNSRYNLFTFTEQFYNAAWSKDGVTIPITTEIAPDGTSTADLIVCGTGLNTNKFVTRTDPATIAGTTYTFSVYAKNRNGSLISIIRRESPFPSMTFNFASPSGNFQDVGNGWYRIWFTFTASTSTSAQWAIGGVFGTTDLCDCYIWGAQLEIGSTPKTYQHVGASADFNFQAPLTIGNSFALDAPFPGSIALLKLSAVVPTPEQATFMYDQDKQLFRANAQSVLPDTNFLLDLSYDDATDRWVAISTTSESYWSGLVRTSVTPSPAGSYSRVVTTSGIELSARTTSSPGVDITIPAYNLREELPKRAEPSAKLGRQSAVFDYIGGFTATTTSGSAALTSVTNLTYPTSYIGARISGTGIPANAFITSVSGNTIYISAAATATTTGLSISFLDFELPVGFETESVTTAGVVKQEGATKDYTRLFDGFIETIRFAVAPGATTWVRIQATKSI